VDSKLTFARGDVISRKYEIEHHLGGGLFGQTYLARHIKSGKHLAIKFVFSQYLDRPGGMDRFRNVLSKVKAIRHPGFTRLGEIAQHNEANYCTLEYFQSQSLREVLEEYTASGQAFTLQEACQIIIQVLQSLAIAHEAGLVHRTMKPENVLVQTNRSGPGGSKVIRKIKVTGLGFADLLDPGDIEDRYQDIPHLRYLAPEMAGFGAAGTSQADIYSVGVMLYELLCGQTPHGTFLSPTQLRDDLPHHVDDLVEIALAHNPEDRYPSANDMVRDIQRSFQLEMQAETAPTSFKNMLIGLMVTVGLLIGAAVYFGLAEPVDPLDEAYQKDAQIRKEVQDANPLPTDAEVKAMTQLMPDMVYVPGGTFVMGRLHQEDATLTSTSEPLAQVIAVKAFFIDRFEYPNKLGAEPVGRVSWNEAKKTCEEEAGKRLCTEAEWEKACKGHGNLIYTYGDTWDPSFCGAEMEEKYTLGNRKDCISGYGVFDMSGGFREWSDDAVANKDSRRITKGGLRGNPTRGSRCSFSVDEDAGFSHPNLTFRCCADIEDAVKRGEEAEKREKGGKGGKDGKGGKGG